MVMLRARWVEIALSVLTLCCLLGQWETGFRPTLPKKGDFPEVRLCSLGAAHHV